MLRCHPLALVPCAAAPYFERKGKKNIHNRAAVIFFKAFMVTILCTIVYIINLDVFFCVPFFFLEE